MKKRVYLIAAVVSGALAVSDCSIHLTFQESSVWPTHPHDIPF